MPRWCSERCSSTGSSWRQREQLVLPGDGRQRLAPVAHCRAQDHSGQCLRSGRRVVTRDRSQLGRGAPAGQLHGVGDSYRMVAADGGIFSYCAGFYGSMGGRALNAPIVGMATLRRRGLLARRRRRRGVLVRRCALLWVDRRPASERPGRRNGGRQGGLLARRRRRWGLQLRRGRLLRLDGRKTPQLPHRRHDRHFPTAGATGSSPPTAASSPSAMRSSTVRSAAPTSSDRSSASSRRRAGTAIGWWPPMAGSSATATPTSTVRSAARRSLPHRRAAQEPRRQRLLAVRRGWGGLQLRRHDFLGLARRHSPGGPVVGGEA